MHNSCMLVVITKCYNIHRKLQDLILGVEPLRERTSTSTVQFTAFGGTFHVHLLFKSDLGS